MSKENSPSAPAAPATPPAQDWSAKLEELKRRNLELRSAVQAMQVKQVSSTPEQMAELKKRQEELKARHEIVARLYLSALRGQDAFLAPAPEGDPTDSILKSVAVRFFTEQKVPNELWKSLES